MRIKKQKELINQFMDNVKGDILNNDYPESWGGVEFRWLIRERFNREIAGRYIDKTSSQYREFNNECIKNNWY